MRHPNNRGERRIARDKFRRKAVADERYDNGRKERYAGPDFSPVDRDRKATKREERAWRAAAAFLPSGTTELSSDELILGGRKAGGDRYVRF